MAKVLITGVAGFIAHRTCEMLLEQGHIVYGIDNLNDYYDIKLKEFRLNTLKSKKNFYFSKIDIENKSDLNWFFNENPGIEIVLNLAARAGVRYSIENPDIYVSTNINGTLNLLEKCRELKIGKFVLASTSSLYAGCEMPFKENLNTNKPLSPYAATKGAAESLCYSYHHLYGIDISVVRYFTVYGPMSRPDMAQFRFMRLIDNAEELTLYGDGTFSRDFTYIDDIAEGTILATKKLGFEIINLGGGKNPISINQMIAILEDQLGTKAKIKYLKANEADMSKTWADISKAKELLGWEPKKSLKEGLELSISHYMKNRSFYNSVEL